MPKAVVCITTDIGSADDVLRRLRACDGVEEAFRVHGVYDIIARIRGDTGENLKRLLTDRVIHMENVQKTLTMMIAEQGHPP